MILRSQLMGNVRTWQNKFYKVNAFDSIFNGCLAFVLVGSISSCSPEKKGPETSATPTEAVCPNKGQIPEIQNLREYVGGLNPEQKKLVLEGMNDSIEDDYQNALKALKSMKLEEKTADQIVDALKIAIEQSKQNCKSLPYSVGNKLGQKLLLKALEARKVLLSHESLTSTRNYEQDLTPEQIKNLDPKKIIKDNSNWALSQITNSTIVPGENLVVCLGLVPESNDDSGEVFLNKKNRPDCSKVELSNPTW